MKVIFIWLSCLLLFGCGQNKNKEQTSWGMRGESDSTIIGYVVYQDGERVETRYYFKPENYNEASKTIQLLNIPYMGLNKNAQRELNDGLKYIISVESIDEID